MVQFAGFWIAKNVGKTKFGVFFDGNFVYESQIIVRRSQGAAMCRVSGDGLKRAIVSVPAVFQVDMRVRSIVRILFTMTHVGIKI